MKQTIDPIIENAKDRDLERIISTHNSQSPTTLFLKSSSDRGTIRNMGRRGSIYAPNAIMNIVKKLSAHNQAPSKEFEVADELLEISNFDKSQEKAAKKIDDILSSHPSAKTIIHLGGGHDHIFPLLTSINKIHKKITIINIDAHLDTRIDTFHHSGTPFRQFDKTSSGDIELYQFGILELANTKSTMSDLVNIKEYIVTYNDLKNLTQNFQLNENYFNSLFKDKDRTYVISLDADALHSSIMEGVSAVNHKGLSYDFVEELFVYAKHKLNTKYFGIYEYNPLYDNLSQKGARALSSLIYEIFDRH